MYGLKFYRMIAFFEEPGSVVDIVIGIIVIINIIGDIVIPLP